MSDSAPRSALQMHALGVLADHESGRGFSAYAIWLRAGALPGPLAESHGYEWPGEKLALVQAALEVGQRLPQTVSRAAEWERVWVVQRRLSHWHRLLAPELPAPLVFRSMAAVREWTGNETLEGLSVWDTPVCPDPARKG